MRFANGQTWYALDQVELPDVEFERYVADQTSKNVARKTLEPLVRDKKKVPTYRTSLSSSIASGTVPFLMSSAKAHGLLPLQHPHDLVRLGPS
jgi:hypothetical protein